MSGSPSTERLKSPVEIRPEITNEICCHMVEGHSLKKICRETSIPFCSIIAIEPCAKTVHSSGST